MKTVLDALLLVFTSMVLVSCSTSPVRAGAPPEEGSLEEVFARVSPSVVVVRTEGREAPLVFGQLPTARAGIGSGVLISDDGKVVTAAHVVQTADRIEVAFANGKALPARVVSADAVADVALLQLGGEMPKNAQVARLGDSDEARVGSRVFVIGAPLGISHSLTAGHLSARRRPSSAIRTLVGVEYFQTDAAINQGNSGGPLFNMKGEVIGIVSYIVSQSGGSQGLGFAVTSNVARELLLERHVFWGGVEGIVLSGAIAQVFNTPKGRSAFLIQRVARNSPAARLGLRPGAIQMTVGGESLLVGGDIVLEVQGITAGIPGSYARISEALGKLGPEDEIRVQVLRGGEILELRGR